MRVKLSRRARWAVPGTAVAVTAVAVAALQIPAALASPNLPNRTPAQLLASISADAKVPPMTGTVVETASLGLPQLPQTGSATSMTSLLSGSHTMKVYYQDAKHYRLEIPQPESETDVIASGSKLWLWQSTSNSVTEFVQPADNAKAKSTTPKLPQTPLTPQQAANQVLAAVGKTTLVSDQANVMVAGEPSYQLVLAPKDQRSLVGRVVIAVDGKYGVPLRVQLYAKGASSPAFQVGYTALQWVAPAQANFSFTPPHGASVDVVNPKDQAKSGSGSTPGSASTGTYGNSWLTVVALPQQDLMQGFGTGSASSGSASSSGKQQNIASANNQGVGVSSQELLNALLGSAKPVHGSWGSGTLVTTSLVSMLMTGGEVYIGAVQPSVLYSAVGHTTP
jgi:outer membrane lipoprotein-sorting protein